MCSSDLELQSHLHQLKDQNGVGTVPGVLVGVLVFELMKVALQFMNVNSSYTYIVQGLVIIVAVAIDIRKYLAKK